MKPLKAPPRKGKDPKNRKAAKGSLNLALPGPINPGDPVYQRMFEDLQGNILKGHDGDYASHIFIKFNKACNDGVADQKLQNAIRNMIKERIAKSALHVTTAARQFRETNLYRQHKIRGKVFVNFFLTYSGYTALGLADGVEFKQAFKDKMAGSKIRLNDPAYEPDDWQGYEDPLKIHPRSAEIDAMILIADDDEEYLNRTELRIINTILIARRGDPFESLVRPLKQDIVLAHVVTVQRGKQLRATDRNDQFNGHPIEHFGYLDGISNPLFLTTDQKRVDDFMGDEFWKPWAPLDLVLIPDPHPLADRPDATGSYLVFRKLEQDVHKFRVWKAELARILGVAVEPDPQDPVKMIDRIDRVGALVIGRYKEGTPTTETPPLINPYTGRYDPQGHPYQIKITNDFTYTKPDPGDEAGLNCPFHAHIRKANPRTDESMGHRIVRRGITYGARSNDLTDAPSRGVGMLFMCFQSDIKSQFEYIQRSLNGMEPNSDDQNVNDNVDPIMGQINDADLPQGQEWPDQIASGQSGRFRFADVVTLKGGEYFFAPSVSFLKNIIGKGESIRGQRQKNHGDVIAKVLAEKGL